MALLQRLARPLRTARTWIVLGTLAPIGMLAVSGVMLNDLRQDAWAKAEQTSTNLLQVIERDIARNVEIFDLSLRATAHNIKNPELISVSVKLRQLILFDRAATARDMGVMFVLDENGDIAIDEASIAPRKGNYADREYFRVHKARADVGLHIGQPIVSRLTGERMLPFSRRIEKADGSFGGVAFGSLKLSYFSHLFDRIGLGREGAINLYLRDGTRVMRHPYVDADIGANIAGAPTFERFVSSPKGSFVGISVRDGVERHYAFTQVGDLPLVLNVALSTREIEAEWRSKAMVIGLSVLILCGLTIALSLLFGRELRRRTVMENELARQAHTDALTGLPNRRHFEHTLAVAQQTGKPLSLLVVDADHFKAINDVRGHVVGDEVLRSLAQCLSASLTRPNDLACRVGGEEFAVLLPDTDRASALRVAAKIHEAVASLTVRAAGILPGSVTVSIGAATSSATGIADGDLYHRADSALYEAKAAGRNRTRCFQDFVGNTALARPPLRLVGT